MVSNGRPWHHGWCVHGYLCRRAARFAQLMASTLAPRRVRLSGLNLADGPDQRAQSNWEDGCVRWYFYLDVRGLVRDMPVPY